MTLSTLLTQTVTVNRRSGGAADEYGNPAVETTQSVTYKARLEPLTEREIATDRDAQISDHRLFLPPTAAIDGGDQVVADGKTYEVIGPPQVHRQPRRAHHVEVRLRYVEG